MIHQFCIHQFNEYRPRPQHVTFRSSRSREKPDQPQFLAPCTSRGPSTTNPPASSSQTRTLPTLINPGTGTGTGFLKLKLRLQCTYSLFHNSIPFVSDQLNSKTVRNYETYCNITPRSNFCYICISLINVENKFTKLYIPSQYFVDIQYRQ